MPRPKAIGLPELGSARGWEVVPEKPTVSVTAAMRSSRMRIAERAYCRRPRQGAAARCSGGKRCEHLLRMAIRLHVVHHLGDVSLRVDQERRALDAPVGLTAELLLAPDAVLLGHRVL